MNYRPKPGSAPSAAAIELLRIVRDQRDNEGLHCVHCASPDVLRWGTFSGRQRYRCKVCRRTFSDLTGTPMYRTKRLHAWPHYLGCLQRSDTIRGSAKLIGVHPTTTFRWRHRYLAGLHMRAPALRGVVEVLEFRLPYSEKGSRRLGRRPAKRGLRGLGFITWPQRYEYMIQACDRSGTTRTLMTGSSCRPNLAEYGALLDPHLGEVEVLLAVTQRLSPAARYAAFRGVDCVRLPRWWPDLVPDTSLAHLWTVTDSVRRLRFWLHGFRGVATKYLHNYLAWRRLLDRTEEELIAARYLAAALPPPTLNANTARAAAR